MTNEHQHHKNNASRQAAARRPARLRLCVHGSHVSDGLYRPGGVAQLARIVPFGPISISPAASVLHYGTEVFEGLKAYRRPDGAVQLFRPWENVARLNRSCDRLGLPRIDERDGLQAIRELVKTDAVYRLNLLPVPRSISARFCILRILRLPCTVCMRRRLQSFCLRREAISQTV